MPQFNFHTTAEDVLAAFPFAIKDRVFLITGTSSGSLGASTATYLAHGSPAHIVLISRSRSRSKVQPVIDAIAAVDSSIPVTFVTCDLASQLSIRAAATSLLSNSAILRIDLIINNAGIMAPRNFATDDGGNELQFSANHLGHFLLTNLILPRLSPAGRVVNLTSRGHLLSGIRFDDLNFSVGATYNPWLAYGQSKTANILFTLALHQRGISAVAVHPGNVATGLGSYLIGDDLDDLDRVTRKVTGHGFELEETKNMSQGVATVLVAALDSSLGIGKEKGDREAVYMENCEVAQAAEWAVDGESARRLWRVSEELVGGIFDIFRN